MTANDARLALLKLAQEDVIPRALWLDFEVSTSGPQSVKALDAMADWSCRQPHADWKGGFAEAIAALRADVRARMAAPSPPPDAGAEHPAEEELVEGEGESEEEASA